MPVFVDDSGDPGFKLQKGSSPIFVIALIVFEDSLEAEKTAVEIKGLRRKLKVSDRYEFKFNKTDRKFRLSFFNAISRFSFKIRAVVVPKEEVRSLYLKTKKERFYNYAIKEVLKQSRGTIKNAKLKFDKRGEKTLRDELRVYLSRELDNKRRRIFKDLKFVDSKQNVLIQLADMVAGSIYSDYTGKDTRYLKILKKRRRIQDIWVFK